LLVLGLESAADTFADGDDSEVSNAVPERIGPYLILEPLGEGGMGVVYLAEQQEPLRRRVALKLMKRVMNSDSVLARFQSERQVLAMMNHPGVARVFDAGETADGRPYFVMEYVQGTPITAYCDRHQLSVAARLSLFVQVCEAIHHAHQKGVIHRDIKPSNVLVEERDGKPVVRVIDFGIAKAIHQSLAEEVLSTEHGLVVGTLAYMSPEQAGWTVADVDTRSDVYSLGVLLYELLVGALPIDPQRLRQAALGEILRLIREDEPPKPTTRIEKLGDTAVAVARQRQTSVRALLRFLKGDLDWITMRALEKNPARRYASASEFAADIERHLSGEPVAAGPPGPAYRIWKLARKHRVAAAAVLTVIASLALWTGVMAVLYLRALQARELVQMEIQIEVQMKGAVESDDKADRRELRALSAKVIEGNRRFMGQTPAFARFITVHLVFHRLTTDRPGLWSAPGAENFKFPEVRALESEALQIIERSLDEGDISAVDVLLSLSRLGLDDVVSLERLSAKAFDLAMTPRSKLDPYLLGELANLLEGLIPQTLERAGDHEAERLLRQLASFRRSSATPIRIYLPHTLYSLAQILTRRGSSLRRRSSAPAAEPLFREALEMLREADEVIAKDSKAEIRMAVLELESELGACLTQTEKFAEAESLLQHASNELTRSHGIRSVFTQVALNRMRALYERQGQPEKVATLQARLPDVSVREMWDLGPAGALSPIDKMMVVRLGDASAVVFIAPSSRPSGGWGRLEKESEGYVKIHESKDSLNRKDFLPLTPSEASDNTEHRLMNCDSKDCDTRWILRPHAVVRNAAHERALVFYSKWKKDGVKNQEIRIGTSLAIWRNLELPAERPALQPSSEEPTLLFGQDEPSWGTAAFVSGNTLFVYADALLAQVPLNQALMRKAWKFYAGGERWSENWRDAKPVAGLGDALPFSIHWNDYLGKYLLAAGTPREYYKLQLRAGKKPEGPFRESVFELQQKAEVGAIHAELSASGGRVEYVTLQRWEPLLNLNNFLGTTSTPDPTHLFAVEFDR
jgi:serine/threonine protein kinase/tetratricopeptide (TPR) repeat protein